MIEKFNKNAKVEKFTNMLGIVVRLIVIDPLRIAWDRCILLNLRSKTRQKATLFVSYLDLFLSIGRDGPLHTSIYMYDKRDDLNFRYQIFRS